MASRSIITQLVKKTVLGTLIGVAAFGSLMVIPVGHVTAAPLGPGNTAVPATNSSTGVTVGTLFDTKGVTEQAQLWSSMQAATWKSSTDNTPCMVQKMADPNIVNTGDWLGGNESVRIGMHVDAQDGSLACGNENSWFTNLLDAAGFAGDYLTPGKKIFGPTFNNNQSGGAPTVNPIGSGPGGTNEEPSRLALKKLFATAFFSSSTLPTTAPDYLAYQILQANFEAPNACNAKVVPAGINANDFAAIKNGQTNGKNNLVVDILTYDPATNNRVSTKYYYQNVGGISVGYGLNVAGAADATLDCNSIMQALKNPKYTAARIGYTTTFPKTANIGAAAAGGAGAASTSADAELNCGSKLAVILNPLNWLMCPIVEGLATVAKELDSGINNMMTIDTKTLFAPTSGYHAAWVNMRVYALIFLVIATLIIVISQALGFEILDAYTVRKVLPRLLIAAIAITISWQLMTFFVNLTNDLGTGIRAIIYAPFSHLSTPEGVTLGAQGLFVANLIGAGAIVALGVPGLLSFIATAALAVAVAFLVLVLRQMLITMLVILAPVAIVCYILPNTKKVYDIWWDSFSKGLMMFPIIAAFIAVGRVGAVVASSQGGGLNSFIAFVSYFAPYFLLPMTFKLAGGAIGALGGMVNDRGRGGFDRLKNFRGNQIKKNTEAIKAGKRWQGNPVADRLSHTLQTGSLLGQAGFNPLTARSRIQSARSSRISAMSAEAEKSTAVRAVMGNDDLLQASVHGTGTEADTRAYLQNIGQGGQLLEQNVASVRQARRDMGQVAFEDFAAANIAGTGTGYASGPAEMLRTINRVAGGDRARATRILNSARGQAQKAQRSDLYGAGFGTSADQLQQLYEGRTTAAAVDEVMTDESLLTKSAGEIGTSRNNALNNMSGAITRRIARADADVATARATGNVAAIGRAEHEQKRILAHTAGLLDVAGSASPENAQVIGAIYGQNTTVTNVVTRQATDLHGNPAVDASTNMPVLETVAVGTRVGTIGEKVEQLRPDREFGQYRREYSSQTAAAAAGALGGPQQGAPGP